MGDAMGSWTHLVEISPGGAVALVTVVGDGAPEVAAGCRSRPVGAGEALPPLALSRAWRLAEDGSLAVDLAVAREAAEVRLHGIGRALASELRHVAEDAELIGDGERAAEVTAVRATLLMRPDLSGLQTPEELAGYSPPAWAAARAMLSGGALNTA